MTTRSPGRPRSESAHRAILGATTELIERDGYGRVTMESIARRAGVSKQTVYRWWPTKSAILLEALNEGAAAISPLRDTGSFETDLRTFREARLPVRAATDASRRADGRGPVRRGPRRGVSHRLSRASPPGTGELLDRGRNSGELAATADTDLLVELVFGTLWYRILAQNRPLNRVFADRLTHSVLMLGAVGNQ